MQRTLFVYGTLMQGERHHDVLGNAEFLGRARTLPEYDLVLVDYFPALLPAGQTAVEGELYRVEQTALEALDVLEEVPDYYLRVPITLADGRCAETYLLPRDRAGTAPLIPSGNFRQRS
jgi:gamma-glutamylcyclotransferase (GGCT)/AIG2-like uncharacterized protein YtfP